LKLFSIKDFDMMLTVASLIRKLAIDMTPVGNALTKTMQELKETVPEINRGKIDPGRLEEACNLIAKKLTETIEKITGHGLAKEKAAEFLKTIKTLQDKRDFKGLIKYPFEFALAWKHRVFAEV
jgi:hypothetical protein